MTRILSSFISILLLFSPCAVFSEGPGLFDKDDRKDMREFVEIPEGPRQVLREDMLDHLAVLNEILDYLGQNDLAAAADAAEAGMGRSLLGKYQDVDMRPGRYMPEEMRKIGRNLHKSAGEFARIARSGDLEASHKALHELISQCIACHYSYRTR